MVGGTSLAWMCTGLKFAHAAGPEVYQLRIIHTNDHHARIEPVIGGTPPAAIHGGVARRKPLIDAIRGEDGNQLLLDAGDVFQGTLWFTQYLGQADLEFYNALGYEAVAIGNHEFDKGQQPLADFIRWANFPVLSANIAVAADVAAPIAGLFKPWIVKEVGGQKIGIFGLTTEETAVLSSPGPGVAFTNHVEAARRAVAAETNLGNLIADAMLDKARPAGAQVAIMNGGGIRTSIDAGPITLGEILEVQPFGNTLALVTISSAQLKQALENGVSQIEQVAGRFPQVAGMRFTFNPAAPAGSRVVAVEVANGQGGYAALDPAGSYRVAANNFTLNGGDGYTALQNGTNKSDTGFIDSDVTAEHIRAHSPVGPAVEGRITQGQAAPAPAPGTPAQLPRTGDDLTPLWWLAALSNPVHPVNPVYVMVKT